MMPTATEEQISQYFFREIRFHECKKVHQISNEKDNN